MPDQRERATHEPAPERKFIPDELAFPEVSKSTRRRLEKAGELPARTFLSQKISGWYSDQVAAYHARKRAEAEARQAQFQEQRRVEANADNAKRVTVRTKAKANAKSMSGSTHNNVRAKLKPVAGAPS